MIVSIEAEWNAGDVVRSLSDEQYDKLRRHLTQMELPKDREKFDPWMFRMSLNLIDLHVDAPILAEMGISYKIKRFKHTYRIEDHPEHRHLHVHIPNVGLLAIREVMVLENACTNLLQSYLDQGWRMIAVCPPCSQRRPDYIIGRSGTTEDQ